MAEFFECDSDDLPDGRWEWMDGDRFRVWPMSRVLRSRRKTGTWGFCHDKREIHIWVAKWAKKRSVIRLLAHEIGHTIRPYHRSSSDEESKAEQYADVAQMAFDVMCDLLDGITS